MNCLMRVRRARRWCCWSTRRVRVRRSAHDSRNSRKSSRAWTDHPRVGVCLDTCHLFASGYDLDLERTGTRAPSRTSTRIVGFDRLKVFHLNDSKKPLGSRVDRHEHIGKGCLGLEPFRMLVNDQRFAQIPDAARNAERRGQGHGPITVDPLDEQNLNTLRGLVAGRPRSGGSQAMPTPLACIHVSDPRSRLSISGVCPR